MAYSFYRQLEKRILYLPLGAVVTIADFTDIAGAKTVSKMLTRLSKEGVIRRVMRSVFWKPDGNESEPEPNEVAKALARENGWTMAPSKDTALHLIGMVEVSPKVWTYVTNGTYRKYHYGNHKISFSHSGKSIRSAWSEKTLLLVQCLKAYGKEQITEEVMRQIMARIKGWDLKRIADETKSAAAWIRETTKIMCGRLQAVSVKNHNQRIEDFR